MCFLGLTPLNLAFSRGHEELAMKLLTHSNWTNDQNGNNVLHQATKDNHLKIIDHILKHLRDNDDLDKQREMIHHRNGNGETPFHLAAKTGNVEVSWTNGEGPRSIDRNDQ